MNGLPTKTVENHKQFLPVQFLSRTKFLSIHSHADWTLKWSAGVSIPFLNFKIQSRIASSFSAVKCVNHQNSKWCARQWLWMPCVEFQVWKIGNIYIQIIRKEKPGLMSFSFFIIIIIFIWIILRVYFFFVCVFVLSS